MKVRMCCMLFVLLSAATSLHAQVTTATFYGIVKDPTGAVIPGAQATLVNEGTGASRDQVVGSTGEFAFQFLPVGSYRLQIEAQGFKTHQMKGVQLSAGQQVRQAYTLEVGNITDQIEVTGQAPLVNAVTAEQRQSHIGSELSSLPVARRTLSDMFMLGTGVANAGLGQFGLNGLGRAATTFSMDGIDASANPQAPQAQFKEGHNYISIVTMDAVQEVQVSKGVFSAEFGRALGGNINVITKSGTNTWHGSMFELFNSEELNARQQFLTTKPGTTFNQYGASLGGPIIKDRIFIFGAFEGYQERSATTVQGTVPVQKLRDDMSAAFPAYKPLLDLFPLPNQATAPTADTGRYIGVGSVSASEAYLMIRPDVWLLRNKLLLTGSFVRSVPNRTVPSLVEINPRVTEGVSHRFNITSTYIGGPTWTMETRIGYNRADRDRNDGFFYQEDKSKKESVLGGRRMPAINALGFNISGEYNIIGRAPHYSAEQKFVMNLGKHSLKFGGQYYHREIGSVNIENPVISYQTRADLIANTPSQAQFTFGRGDFDASGKEWSLFIQDDFRATPRLTLNLGLRYDYFGNITSYGHDDPTRGPYVFNFSSMSFPDFIPGPFRPYDDPFDSDAVNFGPRFGFAFNPDGKSQTVIRGGVAIMYTGYTGEIVKNMTQNAPDEPFRTQISRADAQRLGVRYPAYNEDVLKLVKQGLASPSFQMLDTSQGVPYSINFTMTVERAITRTLGLETAFVGTRGIKFGSMRYYNEVNRITGIRPNPKLSSDRYYDGSESTHYYAWQTTLRKMFSRGLSGNIFYTWGKTISYNRGDIGFGDPRIQDFFDIRSNKGPAEGDIAHSFTTNFSYDLPGMEKQPALLRMILSNWQVSGLFAAQTGQPLVITQSPGSNGQRPDLVDPQNAVNKNRGNSLTYLNRAAFAQVPESSQSGVAIRAGNLGAGAIRGPGLWNIDLGISKSFPVREGIRVMFRSDLLNAFNHTNYTSISTNIKSSNFGQITGTAGTRRVQFSLRLTF